MSRKAFSAIESLPSLLAVTRKAGALILTYYRQNHIIDRKLDASPVTEADRKADKLIVDMLAKLPPFCPIVSEEGLQPDVREAEYFWLVDPLDGTKSFIRGKGHFTVNIGLIENGLPVLGVILDPVSNTLYWGSGKDAFRVQGNGAPVAIKTRTSQKANIAAFISHSQTNERTENYLVSHNVTERKPCSSSIKFCFLAEGLADIYPRFGPTMEWDTAAGHAILLAAGGKMTTPEGEPFIYGKPGFLNGDFVASGR